MICTQAMSSWTLALLAASQLTVASAEEHQPGQETEREFHKHLLAVFVGVTHEGRRENGVSLGLEYERRLSERYGVGALVERTLGDLDFTVYAASLAYHAGPWKLYLAPGIEDSDRGSEALLRLGAEYGFEVGAWEVSPQLDVDFVDGEQVAVVGITFGKGF